MDLSITSSTSSTVSANRLKMDLTTSRSSTSANKVRMELDTSRSSTSANKFKMKQRRRKSRMSKRKVKEPSAELFDVGGVTPINLSKETQVFVGCVVFENISFEEPWTTISKEKILDHIDLYSYDSEFFTLKHDVENYPDDWLLIGYFFDPGTQGDWFRIIHDLNAKVFMDDLIQTEKDIMKETIQRQIERPLGDWNSLGSEPEVNCEQIKNTRPLFNYEIKSRFPKDNCYRFKMRKVEDARDGYVELLPDPRFVTETIRKARVDMSIQTDVEFDVKSTQTDFKYSVNDGTQYEYEYREEVVVDTKFEKGREAAFKSFVNDKAKMVEDCLLVNNSLNFFVNDYTKLVKGFRTGVKYTDFTMLASLTSNIAKKMVSSIAWNYFESSMIAVSYSSTPVNSLGKENKLEDEVLKAMYGTTPVHLWTYDNEIHPKLYLEAKSDVSYLSFCPYEKDVLIGGGVNGQIFIWDLAGRVSDVEKVEVLNSRQLLIRVRLAKLMKWYVLNEDKSHVDPVFISPLKYSHLSTVTHIKWLGYTQGISPNGKTYKGSKILQFMTFSADGSVIIWDLKRIVEDYRSVLSINYVKRKQRQNKLKHLRKPSFIPLGKTLIPNYKLCVKKDNVSLPIMTVLNGGNPILYEPENKFDPNPLVRTKFKITGIRKDYQLPNIVGTATGEISDIVWFGYDYHEATNLLTETAQLKSYQCIHDGPIVACVVNPQILNTVLTVGGKIFAIWYVDHPKPLYWRKAVLNIVYNNGTWFSRTASLFALVRSDGCIEIWNILESTERPIHTIEYVGTKSINFFGGITQSEIRKNSFIVCDLYGNITVYILPHYYFTRLKEDEMERLREVFRGKNEMNRKMVKWIEKLNESYQNIEELFQTNREHWRKVSTRSTNLYVIDTFVSLTRERKLSQVERMNRIFKKQDWKNVNEEEMFNIIMKQKKINLKELSKYRAPLEEAAEATKEKNIKIERMLLMKDDIFRRAKDNILKDLDKTRGGNVAFSINVNVHEAEEMLHEYELIEAMVVQYIQNNPHEPTLKWQNIKDKAKEKIYRKSAFNIKNKINFEDFMKSKSSTEKINFTTDYKVRNYS